MSKRKSSGGGSTLYGVLAGLLIGLLVAAGVAYYVLKAPMPFADKASRSVDKTPPQDPGNMPDPNLGLQAKEGGNASTAPGQLGLAPLTPLPSDAPGVGTASSGGRSAAPKDDLGALIATLPQTTPSSVVPSPSSPKASAKNDATPAPATSGPYYLQVGSFRVLEDAESLRARILLMGMPAEIQRAEVNGMQVNRVRVGPFAKLDDMNRTRAKLGEEKIPSTVVRQ